VRPFSMMILSFAGIGFNGASAEDETLIDGSLICDHRFDLKSRERGLRQGDFWRLSKSRDATRDLIQHPIPRAPMYDTRGTIGK
jgi:hypothetical protein